MAEQENWSIFSTEYRKIVYKLVDFRKQEYCRTQNICISNIIITINHTHPQCI